MSPAHGTAAEQLERILYILPSAHREGGMLLEDLAAALGVTREVVLADIEEVTAREYYHPAGSVDTMCIRIERDRVRLSTPGQFDRPTRLNAREALAVQLGLRSLAAESDAARRTALLALAGRIEAVLSTPETPTVHDLREAREAPSAPSAQIRLQSDVGPDYTAEPELEYDPDTDHALLLGVGDDVLRGILSDAIGAEQVVRLQYLKPGSHAPERRRVAPLQLAYGEGTWYLLGFDLDRRAPRIFRLDRTLHAQVEAEQVPEEARDRSWIRRIAEHGPAPYFAAEDVAATVRYSAAIGRWIAERAGVAPEPDGSVRVHHRVANPGWLVRHVLQYGGEAWVEEPQELRERVARSARQLAGR